MARIVQIRDVPKKLVKKQPQEYQEIHKEADKIELRLARAFEVSVQRLRDKVQIEELMIALSLRDINGALALFPDEMLEENLKPSGTIVRDAVLRGGRVGANIVNNEI